MRNLIITTIAILTYFIGAAQEQPAKESIEAAKVGLITSRLNLTTEQSQKFWPVYNEYTDKKTAVRNSLKKIRMEYKSNTAKDDEIKDKLTEMMNLRQKEVDLEKEYLNKFMKVITPRQIAELYKAEHEFSKMLLKELQSRHTEKRDKQ
jgi:Spy/CpxP family protein refolding chaperone